jgi:uncharacterized membrane protein YGL010W
MPIRPNLLSRQSSGYGTKHRDRLNLWLHLVAVPLFWCAAAALLTAVLCRSWVLLLASLLGLLLSLRLQKVGQHRMTPLV